MLEMKEKWGKYKEASTTIWGTNWSYIKISQGTADKWNRNRQTQTHVVYEVVMLQLKDLRVD